MAIGRRAATTTVAFTSELPIVPLKQTILEYLRVGCPESNVEAPFTNDDDDALQWSFYLEDAYDEVEPPAWIVAQDEEATPLSEARSTGWWNVPVLIRCLLPNHGATAEFVQSVENRLHDLLSGIWHTRETTNQDERTPVALRLTDVAAAMDEPTRIYCRSATLSHPKRVGLIGERLEIQCSLTVLCRMIEAE